MILKFFAISAVIAVALGAQGAHFKHSTVIKHDTKKTHSAYESYSSHELQGKVASLETNDNLDGQQEHQNKESYYHEERNQLGHLDHTQGFAYSSQNVVSHDSGYGHKHGSSNDEGYHHRDSYEKSSENSDSHGIGYSSQNVILHISGQDESKELSHRENSYDNQESQNSGESHSKGHGYSSQKIILHVGGHENDYKSSGDQDSYQHYEVQSNSGEQSQSHGHGYSNQNVVLHVNSHKNDASSTFDDGSYHYQESKSHISDNSGNTYEFSSQNAESDNNEFETVYKLSHDENSHKHQNSEDFYKKSHGYSSHNVVLHASDYKSGQPNSNQKEISNHNQESHSDSENHSHGLAYSSQSIVLHSDKHENNYKTVEDHSKYAHAAHGYNYNNQNDQQNAKGKDSQNSESKSIDDDSYHNAYYYEAPVVKLELPTESRVHTVSSGSFNGNTKNEENQSHDHAYSTQSVHHAVKHGYGNYNQASHSSSGSSNNKNSATYKHVTSGIEKEQVSKGHAYSTQSIVLHKAKQEQSKQKNESGYKYSGLDNSKISQKSSYDTTLGLGHFASSEQDNTESHGHAQSSINLVQHLSGQHNSNEQSKQGQSHGHSISIKHVSDYKNNKESKVVSQSASSSSQQNEGSSIGNYEYEGYHYEAPAKSFEYSSVAESNGNTENSHKAFEGYHYEAPYNDHHSNEQSKQGQSHGHTISIKHVSDYKNKKESKVDIQSASSSSQQNEGSSIGNYEFEGYHYEAPAKSYEYSSVAETNGNAEDSHKAFEGYHEAPYNDHHSNEQSKQGQSHGHTISIKHVSDYKNEKESKVESQSASSSSQQNEGSSIGNYEFDGYHYEAPAKSYEYSSVAESNGNAEDSHKAFEGYHYEVPHNYHHSNKQSKQGLSHGYSISIKHVSDYKNNKETKAESQSASLSSQQNSGSSIGNYEHKGYHYEAPAESYDNTENYDKAFKGYHYEVPAQHLTSGKSSGQAFSYKSENNHAQEHKGYYTQTSHEDSLASQKYVQSSQIVQHADLNAKYSKNSASGSVFSKSQEQSSSKLNEGRYSHATGGYQYQQTLEQNPGSSQGYEAVSKSGSHDNDYYKDYKLSSESSAYGDQSSQQGSQSSNGEDYHHVKYYTYPKYNFAYTVEDKHTGDIKSQQESRDGYAVKGEYSLHEPDGTVRVVEYKADKHSGFNAFVKNTGKSHHAEHYYH